MSDLELPRIIQENERFLFVEKPSGWPSVPLKESPKISVAQWLCEVMPTQVLIGGQDHGALHRLDEGTSGVLAFAKQQTTYDQYRELWNTPAVQKRYRAILSAPLAKGLQILHPIGRSAKSSKRSIALLKPEDSRKIRGKPMTAKTTVLGCTALSKNLFDLSIRIETGVPHQIRCHLSSIDRAILGDSLYGGAQASRLYLHCESIEIRDPDKSIPLLKVESKLLASLWPAPRDAS